MGEKDRVNYKGEFPVVGVGSSAGGLEAMQEFLSAISPDIGMAVVIVTHLSPEHKSALVEILSKSTRMTVTEAENYTRLEPNHVFIIPPSSDLVVTDGVLKLEPFKKGELPHLPIDHFLISLSSERKNRAIGIVLSGTGSDGTKGLQAVKAEGGITFAQREDTAKFPEMPRSAVEAGNVDYILSPKEIAKKLLDIKPKLEALAKLADETEETGKMLAYQKILALLKARTLVDFSHYRKSTLNRRISRRMVLRNVSQVEDYAQILAKDAGEVDNLFQDILINVTMFYRDPEVFDALRTTVLPKLFTRKNSKPLRVWVPGCSTGEEAYTIAFCIIEYLGEGFDSSAVQIFATDVNDEMINVARAGVYSGNSLENVSKARLLRFFTQNPGGGWQIKKPIRDICIFAKHNILSDPPFANMDIVSCRNLLIYFDETFQEYVIPLFHYALKNNGYLMLGKSESVSRFGDLFESVDKENKIYVKKPATNVRLPRLPEFHPTKPQVSQPVILQMSAAATLTKTLERETEKFLSQFVPPAVVVNDDLDIVQFRGRTAKYIEPASGFASLNLSKMTKGALSMKLRIAVDKARKEKKRIRLEGVRVSQESMDVTDIEVVPLPEKPGEGTFFLIIFESPRLQEPPFESLHPVDLQEDEKTELNRLRREAEETRSYIQTSSEEKEAANEELRSANEELQASYEELQSINEELQTSREELQASNEELRTVNDELQSRNKEISELYNVVENLINSAKVPMIMVDSSLNIRRITPTARSIFKMLSSDVGRPLSDLKLNLDVPNLTDVVQETITNLRPKSLEVRDLSGRWYKMDVQLYRTVENKIDGAVLTFVDIDQVKRGEVSAVRLEEIIAQSSDAIMTLDPGGKIMTWNMGAESIYGYTANEAIGKRMIELVPFTSRKEAEETLKRVETGEIVQPTKSQRLTRQGRVIDVLSSMSRQVDSKGKTVAIAVLERVLH